MKILTVTHQDVQELIGRLSVAYYGVAGEDLVFVIRPKIRMTDSAAQLLKHKGIEVVRDEAAPIDSAYLMSRKDYKKYAN